MTEYAEGMKVASAHVGNRGVRIWLRVLPASVAFFVVLVSVGGFDQWLGYRQQLALAEPGRESNVAHGALFAFGHVLFFSLIFYGVHLFTSLIVSNVARDLPLRHWMYASALAGFIFAVGFVAFNSLLAPSVITASTNWSTVIQVMLLIVVCGTVGAILLMRCRYRHHLAATPRS